MSKDMTSQNTGIYCEEAETLPYEEEDAVQDDRSAAALFAQADALAALGGLGGAGEAETESDDDAVIFVREEALTFDKPDSGTHARYIGTLPESDEAEETLPLEADDLEVPVELEAEPAPRMDTAQLLADAESKMAGAKQGIAKAHDDLQKQDEEMEEEMEETTDGSEFDQEAFDRAMAAAEKLPDAARKRKTYRMSATPDRKPKKSPKPSPKPSPAKPSPKPSPAKPESVESLKNSCNRLRESIKSKQSAFYKDDYQKYRTWKELCCTRAREYEGDSLLRFLRYVKEDLQQIHHRLSKGMSGTVRFEEPPCYRDDA